MSNYFLIFIDKIEMSGFWSGKATEKIRSIELLDGFYL